MKTVLLGIAAHSQPTLSISAYQKASEIVKAIHASKKIAEDYIDRLAMDNELSQALQDSQQDRKNK